MSEILKPETVTAREAQEARAHKLLRRQFADGYLKATLSNSAPSNIAALENATDEEMVDRALDLADELINQTGGPG